MAKLPPKKEPRMTVASERTSKAQDTGRDQEISALASKTHAAIEAARSKMTDAQRDEADSKARAIFERSNASESDRRRSA